MTVHQIHERVTKPARNAREIHSRDATRRGPSADPGHEARAEPSRKSHPNCEASAQTLQYCDDDTRRKTPYCTRPPVPRSRGSSTSRMASPSMLNPNTASEIAAPGQIAIHGAV